MFGACFEYRNRVVHNDAVKHTHTIEPVCANKETLFEASFATGERTEENTYLLY